MCSETLQLCWYPDTIVQYWCYILFIDRRIIIGGCGFCFIMEHIFFFHDAKSFSLQAIILDLYLLAVRWILISQIISALHNLGFQATFHEPKRLRHQFFRRVFQVNSTAKVEYLLFRRNHSHNNLFPLGILSRDEPVYVDEDLHKQKTKQKSVDKLYIAFSFYDI